MTEQLDGLLEKVWPGFPFAPHACRSILSISFAVSKKPDTNIIDQMINMSDPADKSQQKVSLHIRLDPNAHPTHL
jgi:hypothetical protein